MHRNLCYSIWTLRYLNHNEGSADYAFVQGKKREVRRTMTKLIGVKKGTALFLLFYFVLFTGCQSTSPIKIGFIAGTSGKIADLGIAGRDAVQLLVEQTNDQGGIHGQSIQLVIKDDRQDPEQARRAAEELVREGVAAVIGPMTSAMAMVTTPVFNKARIVAVGVTITTEKLSDKDDFFFRVSGTTRDYAGMSGRYHAETGKSKRLAVLYDSGNRSYCENWLDNFADSFIRYGGELTETLEFSKNSATTFSDLIAQLLEKGPDSILIIANSMDSALICQQIQKMNSLTHIILSDWGATKNLLELGGKSVEGATVVQTYDENNPKPRHQEFIAEYRARYRQPAGFAGAYAYDATLVIIEALKQRQKGKTLKETILEIEQFDGIQEPFSFNEFGDVKRSNGVVSVISNQQFVVLE